MALNQVARDDWQGLIEAARAGLSSGDGVSARRAATMAARVAPDTAEAQLMLGDVWDALGRFAEAARAYKRAVEIEPGSAAAVGGLADALHAAGRDGEALPPIASRRSSWYPAMAASGRRWGMY